MYKNILISILLVCLISFGFSQSPEVIKTSISSYENGIIYEKSENNFYSNFESDYIFNSRSILDYDSLNVNFVGNWPLSHSYCMTTNEDNSIAFVGSGGGVLVIDLEDPSNPVVISQIRSRSMIDKIYYEAASQRIFLGAYFSGLEIWDVSDLNNPARLSRCATETYPRGGVYASGDYAYTVNCSNGFVSYDISDPNNSFITGSCSVPGNMWDSVFENDLAYLSGLGNFRIVDFSTPSSPYVRQSASIDANAFFIDEDILYITSSSGLSVYDKSDSLNLLLIGSVYFPGTPSEISKIGNNLFIANAYWDNTDAGVDVIDITDPTNPVIITKYSEFSGEFIFSDPVNNKIFLSGKNDKFYSVDVSDINNPILLSTMQIAGYLDHRIAVKDDYAYFGSNGFRVLDVSNTANPIQVGFDPEILGSMVQLSNVNDNIAVMAPKSMGGSNKVNIMDISDKTNPTKLAHYTAPNMTYDLKLQGNYAFIATWWDGLRIVDYSNPSSPYLASHILGWVNSNSIPGEDYCFSSAVAVKGNYAYLSDYKPFSDKDTFGIYVVDISDPTNPVFVNRFKDFESSTSAMKIVGNYLYLSGSQGMMEILDITDPLNIELLSTFLLSDSARDIDVFGDFAYIANYILEGVQVINISDPTTPTLEGFYKRSGCFALGVTVSIDKIFISDGIAGLNIYENELQTNIESNYELSIMNYELKQNYPNPFNPITKINYELRTTNYELAEIVVHNSIGQKVWSSPVTRYGSRVTGSILFDGSKFNSGIYYYSLLIDGKKMDTKSMVLIK